MRLALHVLGAEYSMFLKDTEMTPRSSRSSNNVTSRWISKSKSIEKVVEEEENG